MSDELKLILDKLTAIESRQGNIETGIVNLGTRMVAVESEVESIKGSLVGLDARFNGQLEGRLDSINTHIDGLRADVEKGFRSLDRQMDSLSGNITRLHADQRDLEERVDGLQRKAS